MGVCAFFSTRGRISRGRFWLVGATVLGALFLTGLVGDLVVRALDIQDASLELGLVTFTFDRKGPDIEVNPLLAILFLPAAVRRMHDRGRSGWRLVAFALVQNIAILLIAADDSFRAGRLTVTITPPLAPAGEELFAWLVGNAPFAFLVATVWCFVELACLSGTVGDNRYGADPKLRTVDGREGTARPTSA